MILGYKQAKHCTGGQLVRFESGTWALLSEYYDESGDLPKAYIVGTGEAVQWKSPNEWVLVVDDAALEEDLLNNHELEYPNDSGA